MKFLKPFIKGLCTQIMDKINRLPIKSRQNDELRTTAKIRVSE